MEPDNPLSVKAELVKDDRLSGDLLAFFASLISQDEYAGNIEQAARERLDSDEWKQLAARLTLPNPALEEAVQLLRECREVIDDMLEERSARHSLGRLQAQLAHFLREHSPATSEVT